jgi:hypothetical protein
LFQQLLNVGFSRITGKSVITKHNTQRIFFRYLFGESFVYAFVKASKE